LQCSSERANSTKSSECCASCSDSTSRWVLLSVFTGAVSETPVFHTNLVGKKRIQNLHNFEALWHDTPLGFAAFSGKQLSQRKLVSSMTSAESTRSPTLSLGFFTNRPNCSEWRKAYRGKRRRSRDDLRRQNVKKRVVLSVHGCLAHTNGFIAMDQQKRNGQRLPLRASTATRANSLLFGQIVTSEGLVALRWGWQLRVVPRAEM
jgi:hypothetical protein